MTILKRLKILAVVSCMIFTVASMIFTVAIGVTGLLAGCKTSQQQATFNTLYSVEHLTVTTYDGYISLVVGGQLPTNDVPKVSKAFNTFQTSFLVALDAAQYNTNALAPANLVVESQDVINLISNIKKDIK